jgi:Fic family protein
VGLAAADEGLGKEISKRAMKRVILTNIDSKEDEEVHLQYGLGAKRQAQILRVTIEAMEQGAYLTQEDLSRIPGSDMKTVRNDIKKLKAIN